MSNPLSDSNLRNGDLESQAISAVVEVEAKLPTPSPKMTVKLRFGQELEDYAGEDMNGLMLQSIRNATAEGCNKLGITSSA